jgi:hypothetical protein
VPCSYSRHYARDVAYQPGAAVVAGSPAIVAAAAIGRLISRSIGYARAASLSHPQWRERRGPPVWCHAVLCMYLRYGATALQTVPFPHPLRLAALHLPNLSP